MWKMINLPHERLLREEKFGEKPRYTIVVKKLLSSSQENHCILFTDTILIVSNTSRAKL